MTKLAPLAFALFLLGCGSSNGAPGAQGEQGPAGANGKDGAMGAPGKDGVGGKDAAQSGSRIVAKYLVGEDGSRMFVSWFDSMLQVPCAWGVAADLKTRCLPGVLVDPSLSATIVYSDAACTKVIAVSLAGTLTCGKLPPYGQIVLPAAPCEVGSPPTLVLSLGGAMPKPMDGYWLSGGSCTNDLSTLGSFFTAAEVDPSTLVGATVQ